MIGEEVLLDGENLFTDGVPSDLEDRYYQYRINTYNEGKVSTFNLTYLEKCIKYSGNELISLPDGQLRRRRTRLVRRLHHILPMKEII